MLDAKQSIQLNSELFSNYKNHNTLKGLIGISPGGAITFVSQLYTGSISEREIVMRSGFLDLPFDKNGSSAQMPFKDVIKTQEISGLRIHVECAINKSKIFIFLTESYH